MDDRVKQLIDVAKEKGFALTLINRGENFKPIRNMADRYVDKFMEKMAIAIKIKEMLEKVD